MALSILCPWKCLPCSLNTALVIPLVFINIPPCMLNDDCSSNRDLRVQSIIEAIYSLIPEFSPTNFPSKTLSYSQYFLFCIKINQNVWLKIIIRQDKVSTNPCALFKMTHDRNQVAICGYSQERFFSLQIQRKSHLNCQEIRK